MPTKKDATTKSCFVIAPIDDIGTPTRQRSDDLFIHVIDPVTKELGYTATRGDQMKEPGLISRQVVRAVIESDLVIADLSEYNPNVFYELALRHAVVKPIVHVIQQIDKPPFDVMDFRAITYNCSKWDSLEHTKQELHEYIEATERPDYRPASPISVAVDLAAALSGGAGDGELDLPMVFGTVLDQLDSAQQSLGRIESALDLTDRQPSRRRTHRAAQLYDTVIDVIASLEPRERDIVTSRFGFDLGVARSFEKVAEEIGGTPEEVETEFNIAIRKLRHPSHSDSFHYLVPFPAAEDVPRPIREFIATVLGVFPPSWASRAP